ncbi:hypothetical protein [Namhaeicola litoreus]|uniref:Uncharacterized protein n=1 Tax=Namhaeicola litoreus TaxID=1052145 RepID=A0ABW3Y1X5_9FLAO
MVCQELILPTPAYWDFSIERLDLRKIKHPSLAADELQLTEPKLRSRQSVKNMLYMILVMGRV